MSPLIDERRRGWRCALAGLAVTGTCAAMVAAPGGAAAAPPGWAYEMVSPVQKYGGGAVFGHRASDDGNAVAFTFNGATGATDGAYAITPYVAKRGPDGWVPHSGAPRIRAEHRGLAEVKIDLVDFSEDGSHALIRTNDPIDPLDREPVESGGVSKGYDFYDFDPFARTADWVSEPEPSARDAYRAGGDRLWYEGRSADASHVFFYSDTPLVTGVPAGDVLYEHVGGESRVVSVLPNGTPTRGRLASPFDLHFAPAREPSAISSDGSRAYWTNADGRLFLREDGQQTLPVSASRRTGDEGTMYAAGFLAATRDGEHAYFHAIDPLTNDAAGPGVYRYDRAGEQLTLLFSAGTVGTYHLQPKLSEDGGRLYFVSHDVLTAEAQPGTPNLYYWDGEVHFIAPIAEDLPGPEPFANVQISSDGRYAAFGSTISLDPRAPDGLPAIYRFDAQTGVTTCVSCRPGGGVSTQAAEIRSTELLYGAGLYSTTSVMPRTLTDDGRVVFQTAEGLVASDTNGARDVYMFDGVQPQLISSGRGDGSELIDNSDDGRTIFFVTAETLSGWDTDGGFPDVYAARVGGGFPEPPPPPPGGCQGDVCQGALSTPPVFPPPGSSQVEGGDDVPDEPDAAEASFSLLRTTAAQRRAFSRQGRIDVRVRTGASGTLQAVAQGTIGRRQRELGRGLQTVSRGGTVRLVVPLSSAARRQLARGPLRVRVTLTHSRSSGTKSTVLRLPARRAAGRRASRARTAPAPSVKG